MGCESSSSTRLGDFELLESMECGSGHGQRHGRKGGMAIR